MHPEEHSDDGDWETASEESAEYDGSADAGGGSAAADKKAKDGQASKGQHAKKADDAQKQHRDVVRPAGNEVSPAYLSDWSSLHNV